MFKYNDELYTPEDPVSDPQRQLPSHKIKCTLCGTLVEETDTEDHQEVCFARTRKCTFGCEDSCLMTPQQEADHWKKCPKHVLCCVFCQKPVPRGEMENHYLAHDKSSQFDCNVETFICPCKDSLPPCDFHVEIQKENSYKTQCWNVEATTAVVKHMIGHLPNEVVCEPSVLKNLQGVFIEYSNRTGPLLQPPRAADDGEHDDIDRLLAELDDLPRYGKLPPFLALS